MLGGPLPNNKRDLNTADLPGAADDYPEGDWNTRRDIERCRREHVLGLLYFMGNDDAVPEDLQELFGERGLPEDEFEDTDGFPFQIYVREGRRLAGRETFTERDAREGRGPTDPLSTPTPWPSPSTPWIHTIVGPYGGREVSLRDTFISRRSLFQGSSPTAVCCLRRWITCLSQWRARGLT